MCQYLQHKLSPICYHTSPAGLQMHTHGHVLLCFFLQNVRLSIHPSLHLRGCPPTAARSPMLLGCTDVLPTYSPPAYVPVPTRHTCTCKSLAPAMYCSSGVSLPICMTLKALLSAAKLPPAQLALLHCFSLLAFLKVERNGCEGARSDPGINKACCGHGSCNFPF